MADISIEKKDWGGFLDWVTDSLSGARAEIDIVSLDIGAQVQARSLPLFGVTYDHKSNVIEIALEGLDHLIHRPRSLVASVSESGLLSIEIIDEDEARQILKLTRPFALPAPVAAAEPRPWQRVPAKHRMGRGAAR
jgi:hypothetical protein